MSIVIIVLCTLWGLVIVFYFYRKRLKQKIKKTAHQLNEVIIVKEEMKERLESIRRGRSELVQALRDCLAKRTSPGSELKNELESFCRIEFPDIYKIVLEGNKKTASMSILFYCLHQLQFSEQEIATLFNNSRQNVHNICKRLQDKVGHVPASPDLAEETIDEKEKTEE